jgi:hypothetical protein
MGLVQRIVLPCLIGASLGLGLSCRTDINTPVISSFAPTSSPVGTSVVITGTDLTGATSVTLNNLAIDVFSVDSGTQITATIPSAASSGVITVTTPGGMATTSNTFSVTPTITGLSPSSGVAGAASVSITGSGFIGATQVAFVDASSNTFTATTYSVDSANAITVTAPVGLVSGTAYYLQVVASGITSASSPTSFTAN